MKINNLFYSRNNGVLLWNGFLCPMFTREEAEKLAKENAPLHIDDRDDRNDTNDDGQGED